MSLWKGVSAGLRIAIGDGLFGAETLDLVTSEWRFSFGYKYDILMEMDICENELRITHWMFPSNLIGCPKH